MKLNLKFMKMNRNTTTIVVTIMVLVVLFYMLNTEKYEGEEEEKKRQGNRRVGIIERIFGGGKREEKVGSYGPSSEPKERIRRGPLRETGPLRIKIAGPRPVQVEGTPL
jgi:hypothetical protein